MRKKKSNSNLIRFIVCLALTCGVVKAAPFLTCDSFDPGWGLLSFQLYFDRVAVPMVGNVVTDSLGRKVMVFDLASIPQTFHTVTVTATNAIGASVSSKQISFDLSVPVPTYDYLVAPTTGAIRIGNDTWAFGSANKNDFNLLINGTVPGGGYASALFNEGGTIEVVNSLNQWWKWSGTNWTSITGPNAYLAPDYSAANVSGILNDFGGEGANAWTWGSPSNGQFQILRDSIQAGGGYGKLLVHQGDFVIYAEANSGWWQWNGQNATNWTSVNKPPSFP